MKIRWNHPESVISELRFQPNALTGQNEAILFLRAETAITGDSHLSTPPFDESLKKSGAIIAYDHFENVPVLRITNPQSAESVIAQLEKLDAVKGDYSKQATTDEPHKGWRETLRSNQLVLSAIFYQVGNIATTIGGWFRRDSDEIRTGFAFMAGDSTMLLFGKRNQQEKYGDLMQDFGKFLNTNQYQAESQQQFSPLSTAKEVSGWQKIRDVMYSKVIAIKSVSEIIAGTSFAMAGYKQRNYFKSTAGGLVGAGFALGLAIPEKSKADLREELGAKDNDDLQLKMKSLSPLKRLKTKIQANPLILPGSFAGVNNILTLIGAYDEKNYFEAHGKSRKMEELDAKIDGGEYQNSRFESVKKVYSASKDATDKALAYDRISNTHASLKNLLNKADSNGNNLNQDEISSIIKATESKHNIAMKGATPLDAAYETLGILSGDLAKAETELSDANTHIQSLSTARDKLVSGRTLSVAGKDLITVKDGQYWIFNVIQASAFGVANVLYGLSSKNGNDPNAEKMTNQFVNAVASEAITVDATKREHLINIASHYVTLNKNVGLTPSEIRVALTQKIEQLQNHPLLQKSAPAIAVAAEAIDMEQSQHALRIARDKTVKKEPLTSFVERESAADLSDSTVMRRV